MKGRLFRAAALLSLLAALMIGLLSARSHHARDNLWRCGKAGGRLWWAESVKGQLAVRTAAPWPSAVDTRWTAAPAEPDVYLVTAGGLRPLIQLSVLNRPPDSRGFFTRGWESTRLLMRVRYGPSRTNETGMLGGAMPMHLNGGTRLQFYEVLVPHWLAALVAAGPATVWGLGLIPSIMRKNRSRKGLCAGCGYDLRGSLSGVCPECGRAAGQSISAVTGDTVETAIARRTGNDPWFRKR